MNFSICSQSDRMNKYYGFHFQDECSFVSLREVSRLMHICSWFYEQRRALFPQMDKLMTKQQAEIRSVTVFLKVHNASESFQFDIVLSDWYLISLLL